MPISKLSETERKRIKPLVIQRRLNGEMALALSKEFDVSCTTVCNWGRRAGLEYKTKPPWEDWEVDYLIDNWAETSRREILKNLPQRSWLSIQGKAWKGCFLYRSAHIGHKDRRRNSAGYWFIWLYSDDPYYLVTSASSRSGGGGWALEHRYVIAKSEERCLSPAEVVHHLGIKYPRGSYEDKGDNRLENLELLPNAYEHTLEHSVEYCQGTYIKSLENKVEELTTQVKLLQWQIKEQQLGVKG